MLSLAHRFATAFIAYQTGQFTARILGTIEQTCTDGLAGNLLAHQPVLSPHMGSRELNEGLESVEPLAYVGGHALVLVVVRQSVLGRDSARSLQLSLVAVRGRWLVSSLHVLS